MSVSYLFFVFLAPIQSEKLIINSKIQPPQGTPFHEKNSRKPYCAVGVT